jgi:hypothetical protein
MNEFDSILENSLKGVSSGFEQAVEDLNEFVGSLNQAVRKALQPKRSSLRLEQVHEDAEETIFRLDLTVVGSKEIPPPRGTAVGEYRLSHNGYPISAGSWDRREGFSEAERFRNKDSLEQHFKKMLANPTSPLVAQVAFHRRQHKTSA